MTSSGWEPLSQGLFGKRSVGLRRMLTISPHMEEKEVVNGLIMDIFNIFIAQKLTFEKRDMPPMHLKLKFKKKDLLFYYAIDNGTLNLLAISHRKAKELVQVELILAPVRMASGDLGTKVVALLDGLDDPYHRRCS